MRKVFKPALGKEQTEYKNSLNFIDGFEMRLCGDDRDDFSLVPKLLNRYTLFIIFK